MVRSTRSSPAENLPHRLNRVAIDRERFFERLQEQCVAHANDEQPRTYLAILNLDAFRQINDALGLQGGSTFLDFCEAQARKSLRDSDSLTRLSGDEFAFLLNDCSVSKAVAISRRVLTSIDQRAQIGAQFARCSGSIGLAAIGASCASVDQAWRLASEGLRLAKSLGGNECRFSAQATLSNALSSAALDARLRLKEALDAGEFVLHYQPIFEAQSGKIYAAEALMRWNAPSGPIAPSDFIPHAEASGLINPLGEWAIEKACQQLKEWASHGFELSYISVNASARQLHTPRFVTAVERAIHRNAIDPSQLMIEVTESMLALDPHEAQKNLANLCALGVRVCLDDFGTGHASLANLKTLSVSALKIDRGFVQDLPHSKVDTAIVRQTLALARELNLDAIAEGIETPEQHQALCDLGCHLLQGFLLGRPVLGTELLARFSLKTADSTRPAPQESLSRNEGGKAPHTSPNQKEECAPPPSFGALPALAERLKSANSKTGFSGSHSSFIAQTADRPVSPIQPDQGGDQGGSALFGRAPVKRFRHF